MEQNINELVGILLRAEENEIPTELIIDGDTAYDVACVLRDELGKDFEDIGCDFEELLETEDILGVSVDFFRGKSIYFLQPVIASDGETLCDEVAEEVYIHKDVFECIDTDKFDGDIIILEEVSDLAEELEEYFEDATSDLIEDIHDGSVDEDFCIHCAIKDSLKNAYLEGYKDAQMTLRDVLDENIERME